MQIKIELSEDDIENILKERFEHRFPGYKVADVSTRSYATHLTLEPIEQSPAPVIYDTPQMPADTDAPL